MTHQRSDSGRFEYLIDLDYEFPLRTGTETRVPGLTGGIPTGALAASAEKVRIQGYVPRVVTTIAVSALGIGLLGSLLWFLWRRRRAR